MKRITLILVALFLVSFALVLNAAPVTLVAKGADLEGRRLRQGSRYRLEGIGVRRQQMDHRSFSHRFRRRLHQDESRPGTPYLLFPQDDHRSTWIPPLSPS